LPPKTPFIELQSTDSTNNYARQLIDEGMAQHGQSVFAFSQTAGRGQYAREWLADQGTSILLSVIINPFPLTLSRQFELSASVATAVINFFIKYAGNDVTIKWPNDIYWQDRKAGGILIESVIGDSENATWKWAVVGIGININQEQFPPSLPNPVSLAQITGRKYDPVGLAKELGQSVLENFENVKKDFTPVFNDYNARLYKLNQPVRFKKGSRSFHATIVGVSHTGELLISNGIEEAIKYGEIEWLM
jgi:BirA family transcriptional regulator, biotin operon repressor / biotin---[acetyl-CoA-carboxylase] ligase